MMPFSNTVTELIEPVGVYFFMNILPAPGSGCGSSAHINWIKLAQHRKAGELSRKVLTEPFLT